MKQQVSPAVAAGIAVIVLIIAGVFLWRGTGTPTVSKTEDKPAMPAGVQEEFSKRMGGMPGAGGAPQAPKGGGGAPINATMPPTGGGAGAGYMAPPTGR